MSFKTEFVKKAKEYLGEDLEEKIIKSGHEAIIHKYLWSVVSEIGTVKNPTFHQRIGYSNTRIVMDNIEFKTEVKTENNTIAIEKIIDGELTSIDTIVVQDGELFALGRNTKFTTEILEDYLREAFGEKLGL